MRRIEGDKERENKGNQGTRRKQNTTRCNSQVQHGDNYGATTYEPIKDHSRKTRKKDRRIKE